jgi:hypothetical protein
MSPTLESELAGIVAGAAAEPDRADVITAADVRPERIEWVWRYRLGLGKLSVLDGDPDVGKSTLTLDLAARISRGDGMPDGSPGPEAPRAVLLMATAEDGLADTITPRLQAAGADMGRVVILRGITDGPTGKRRMFEAPHDLPILADVIRMRDVALVIVDALMAVLPAKVDSHQDQDVRRALHPLAELAEETRSAVLFIRHNTKQPGRRAIHRGGGSVAILGVARCGLMVVRDAGDPARRLLVMSKGNLAPEAEKSKALTYTIAGASLPAPDGGEPITTSRVRWGETLDLTADDALSALDQAGTDHAERDDAAETIRAVLAEPCRAPELERQVRAAGVSKHAFERERSRLRDAGEIVRRQVAKPGGGAQEWWWERAEHTPPEPSRGSVVGGVCEPACQAESRVPGDHTPPAPDFRGSVVRTAVTPPPWRCPTCAGTDPWYGAAGQPVSATLESGPFGNG